MPITNEQSYYNTFDPTKKYFEVRALAGFVEQSREDNEIQAILKHIVKGLGDAVYKDGTLVAGEGYVRGTGVNALKFTMPVSKFYQGGVVHDVASKVVTLIGSGDERIGIRIVTSIVTSSNDIGLKDPAVGFANYGQPGANRLKIEAVWEREALVVNGDPFYPLYTFKAGVQLTQPKVGQVEAIQKQLAQRTYDESGNYVVAGFNMKAKKGASATTIGLEVGNTKDTQYQGSKAYIQGQEIVKLAAEVVQVERALTTRTVQDERFFYYPVNPAAPTTAELRFELPSQPGAKADKVSVTFDVVRTVTNHNFNGYDELILPGETLQQVLKVYKGGTPEGGNTTIYTNAGSINGVGDYYKFGNGIKWDVAGSISEPGSGDTYLVYMTIRRNLLPAEYKLTALGSPASLNRMALDITQLNTNGTLPYTKNRVDNSRVSSDIDVDYQFYLARIDSVYVDEKGQIGITPGHPDTRPQVPFVPNAVLSLGHVLLPAGADFDKALMFPYEIKRLTMLELRKLVSRIERAEFNAAVSNLNDEGVKRAGAGIASLRGILTEAFTYTHDDIEDDGVDGVTRIKFVKELTTKNLFNMSDAELSVPEIQQTHKALSVGTSAGVNIALDANQDNIRTMSLAYDLATTPLIKALVATTNLPINQFDQVIGKHLTLKASKTQFYMAKQDSFDLTTLNPQAFTEYMTRLTASRSELEKKDALDKLKLATNGTARAIETFVSKEWFWIYSQGWEANVQVKLLVDGRAPRLSGNASLPSLGLYKMSGPLTLNQGNVIGDASIDKTAVGAVLEDVPQSIYAAGTPVRTNANGEFFVAVEIPAGVPSGTFLVTATDEDHETASCILQGSAQLVIRDITAGLAEGISYLIPPVAVKGLTVQLYQGASGLASPVVTSGTLLAGPVPNVTTAGQVDVKISWDINGGDPDLVTLTHTNFNTALSVGSQNITRSLVKSTADVTDPQRLLIYGQNFIVIRLAGVGVNQGFEFKVSASNGAGATTTKSEALFNFSASPNSLSFPEGSASVDVYVSSRCSGYPCSSHQGTAYVNWSGWGTTYTNLKIYVNKNATPIYNGSPGVAGSGQSPGFNADLNGVCATLVFTSSTGAQAIAVSKTGQLASHDPLAQTFTMPETRFVEGVDLYFNAKAANAKALVTVTIREVVNGYPGERAKTLKSAWAQLPSSAITTSVGATVPTYFKFDGLALLERGKRYAITVQTADPEFKLWVAELGGELIRGENGETSGLMLKQAIADGVLFEGATDEAWAPIPKMDLMFALKDVAKFKGVAGQSTTYGTITFAPFSFGTKMVGLHLDTEQLLPKLNDSAVAPPTALKWEYLIPGNPLWYPFQPETYAFFPAVATSVTVRVTMSTTEPTLSPVVFLGSLACAGIKREVAGQYVTKTAQFSQAYQYVRMIAKMDIQPTTQVRWYVSDNQSSPVGTRPAYAAGTTYAEGDVVTSVAINYRSKSAGNIGNTPAASPLFWEAVEIDIQDVVWRELPASGETKTALSEAPFFEHERTIDLGVDSNRKQFRFMLKLTCPEASLHRPPRVRDVIAITNN